MSRTLVAASIAIVLAASLSGCITVQLPPEATPLPQSTNVPAQPEGDATDEFIEYTTVSCIEDDVVLNTPGLNYVVQGDCRSVIVEGAGVEVQIESVGSLIVRGDNNDIEVGELGSVLINGQENEIEATSTTDLAKIEISGNNNDLDTSGSIGTVVLNGNDNEVDYSGAVDKISDNGSNNRVGENT